MSPQEIERRWGMPSGWWSGGYKVTPILLHGDYARMPKNQNRGRGPFQIWQVMYWLGWAMATKADENRKPWSSLTLGPLLQCPLCNHHCTKSTSDKPTNLRWNYTHWHHNFCKEQRGNHQGQYLPWLDIVLLASWLSQVELANSFQLDWTSFAEFNLRVESSWHLVGTWPLVANQIPASHPRFIIVF